MSNVSNWDKLDNKGATVRVPMMARGPVVWHQMAVDPILVQNTGITNQPVHESPIDVPQLKFSRDLSASVL